MKRAHGQFIRYSLVGLASNAILYLVYLALTWAGLGHKTAMTLLYGLGILQTFVLNRRWTFRHDDKLSKSFVRYLITYACGYVFTFSALFLFVDGLRVPHELVMGVLVVLIALLMFAAQKFWVFLPNEVREASASSQSNELGIS